MRHILPGAGVNCFAPTAGLGALGLLSPNWRTRAVAVGLILVWGCYAVSEYRRGVEYREWQRNQKYPFALTEQGERVDVIGQPLGTAVERLGVRPEDCRIFDEPPGVARGVQWTRSDGRTTQLWLARQDGVFNEKCDWTFEQVRDRPVAEVRLWK